MIEQVKVLENEAYHFTAKAAQNGIGERVRFHQGSVVEDFVAAPVIVVEKSEDVEECRFSAAASAAYCHEVAGMNIEGKVFEDFEDGSAIFIGFMDVGKTCDDVCHFNYNG